MPELDRLIGVEESDNDVNILGKVIARGGGAILGIVGVVMEAADAFTQHNLPGEKVALGGVFIAGIGYAIDKLEERIN